MACLPPVNGTPPSDTVATTSIVLVGCTIGVSMLRVLLLMVPSLGLVNVACANAEPYPGSAATGNLSGGSDPPAGTEAVLVQVRMIVPSSQVQPVPVADCRYPVPFSRYNWTWVVPELGAVPVFRTVTFQVPLGVVDVPASFWATNGDPPSLTDMLRLTASRCTIGG